MKKKVLLANGDSWTFGSEIMAPEFLAEPGSIGEGMGNRFKPNRFCWEKYNDYYRIPRIWPTYLGSELGIQDTVNLSYPARSNDTIYETTIHWLMKNYISVGKNTDDLLVVIGWSSPERKNIIITDSETDTDTIWCTLWPAMQETKYYTSPIVKKHFDFYVRHCCIEQEHLKRFVEQNYYLQLFCKTHKIDCFLFNSFYATMTGGIESWNDISIKDSIKAWDKLGDGWDDPLYKWNMIKDTLLMQWDSVDPLQYVNKDLTNGSFKSYIYDNVDEKIRLCGIHPSPESHESWAKFLANYIRSSQCN